MSADLELRQLLLAYAPLVAAVPASAIAIDSVDGSQPTPYVVIGKETGTPTFGLSNVLLLNTTTFTIDAVSRDRAGAIAVGELVREALLAAGVPWTGTSGGLAEELGLEVESTTLDWIE